MMRGHRLATAITGAVLVVMLIPTLVIFVASFSTGAQIQFPPDGLTTRWYSEMLEDRAIWSALGNSLYVASLSTFLALVCGVPAALALPRVGRGSRVLFTALLSLGLSSPTIVSAFAFFDIYSRLGVPSNLTTVAIAVAVTSLPFMLWIVLAALEDEDPNLLSAAATLGADPVEQFVFIRLPLLTPAIVTGALIVFVVSLTDFVVSQVLTNVDNQTLPVFVYSGIRGAISPSLGAVSVLFVAVAALAFATIMRLGRVERFLFRS